MLKNFISFLDHQPHQIISMVDAALDIKKGTYTPKNISGKSLGMLFFNPSLRTRVSFEMAMYRFGGKALSLSAGSDVWNLEFEDGNIMDHSTVEHVKEGARVLSRYVDAIAIRSFAGLRSVEEDLKENILRSFSKHATVPVISMESAMEHPAQALADMMTIRERHKEELSNGKKLVFALTWAPHVKSLPMAVPHSALFAGAYSGCEVRVIHPKGFELSSTYMDHAESIANSFGGSVSVHNDQKKGLEGANVIYAKNWAPSTLYGKAQAMSKSLLSFPDWIVDFNKIKNSQTFLHCLPVRRNLEVTDSALDSPISAVVDQAENRMWAQAALLDKVFSI